MIKKETTIGEEITWSKWYLLVVLFLILEIILFTWLTMQYS